MKKILRQADKQHIATKLHDALIAAGINPVVESTADETYITFPDDKETQVQGVIDAYVYQAPPPRPNLGQLLDDYEAAVGALNPATPLVLLNLQTKAWEAHKRMLQLFKGMKQAGKLNG